MIDVRFTLDSAFLVYYTIVDTSNDTRSKEYFYPDIIFKNRFDAQEYVNDTNENFPNRDYHLVELPIYPKI